MAQSIKTLMYTNIITEDMMWALEEKEGIKWTWVFFEAKNHSLLPLKAHLTVPAIREIKKILLKDFTEEQSRQIFKSVFSVLLELNKTNTALFNVYSKETLFSRKIREEFEDRWAMINKK